MIIVTTYFFNFAYLYNQTLKQSSIQAFKQNNKGDSPPYEETPSGHKD